MEHTVRVTSKPEVKKDIKVKIKVDTVEELKQLLDNLKETREMHPEINITIRVRGCFI